jgi:hypothetical protein
VILRGEALEQRSTIDDLLDFQSSVVLADSSSTSGDGAGVGLDRSVDTFVQQFAWCRVVSEAVGELHALGHFDYLPTYVIKFPIGAEGEEIRHEAQRLQAELRAWVEKVQEVRDATDYFGYFTTKQVRRCCLFL